MTSRCADEKLIASTASSVPMLRALWRTPIGMLTVSPTVISTCRVPIECRMRPRTTCRISSQFGMVMTRVLLPRPNDRFADSHRCELPSGPDAYHVILPHVCSITCLLGCARDRRMRASVIPRGRHFDPCASRRSHSRASCVRTAGRAQRDSARRYSRTTVRRRRVRRPTRRCS